MENPSRYFCFQDRFSKALFSLSSKLYEESNSGHRTKIIFDFLKDFISLNGMGLILTRPSGEVVQSDFVGSIAPVGEAIEAYAEGVQDALYKSALSSSGIAEHLVAGFQKTVNRAYLLPRAMCHEGVYYGIALFACEIGGSFDEEALNFIDRLTGQMGVILANQALYGALRLQNHVYESINDGIKAYLLVTDPKTDRILYMNDVMKEAYGLSDAEGKICHEIIKPQCIKKCEHCPMRTSEDAHASIYDDEDLTVNGRVFSHHSGLMQWPDGTLAHFQYSIDITDSQKNTRASNMDELTNLYNRRAGKLAMEQTLKKVYDEKKFASVCMFDINSLKTVNDNYGHGEGDFLISTIANTIQYYLSPSDFCFRLSGDEFIVVFPRQTEEDATRLMDRVLESLNEKRIALHKPYDIGFCYGIMETTYKDPLTVSEILRQTDARMYEQKRKFHLIEAVRKINDDSLASAMLGTTFTYDRESLYEALVKSTDDYIFVCNLETQVFQFPASMVEELQLPGEFVKNSPDVWDNLIHEDDFPRFYKQLSDIFADRTHTFSSECRAKKRNGEYVHLQFLGYLTHNAEGEPTLFAGMIINLGKKNKVDNTTGLYNINEFETVVNNLLTYRPDARLGVMQFNIDEFKRINELHNREFGDAVLRNIGQRLQACLPSNASVFRMDGDEFAVVFRGGNRNDVQDYFDIVKNAFSSQQELNGSKYFITLSAGVAFYPMDAINFQDLYKYVGYALDYAKSTTAGSLAFFTNEIMVHKTRILELTEMLRDSVEQNYRDFSINYQPQINAATRQIVGTEALLRWTSHKYGPLSPMEFIPLLEKSALIHPVGRWVFRSAIETCKPWMEKHPNFTLSINLSYYQLIHPDFPQFVMDTIGEYGIMPKNIVLEITENHLEANAKALADALRYLRSMGIRIAMDDFGTGYSSLDILKMNPADIVKIDRIFVKNLRNNKFDATFIKFIVALCHEVNIQVCLEGVESQDDYTIIQPMELDTIQGYLFGHPLSSCDFQKLLEQ